MSKLNFLKTAVKDYKVGAFAPSSRFVVQKILKKMPVNYKYVVEYGAGDGAVTKSILKHLRPDGKLIAIEANKNFVVELKKINDPRLAILHDSVERVSADWSKLGLPGIDAIISGIPFTLFNPQKREEIVLNTYDGISSGGAFLLYQHSPLMMIYLKRYFEEISLDFELRNFLPYFIMRALKI